MDDDKLIPECSCGAGPMTVNRSSNRAVHPGRFYYKCPSDENHRRSFLWCDEYHRNDPPDQMPKFLARQTWIPKSGATSSQTDSNFSPVDRDKSKVRQRPTTIHSAETDELPTDFNEYRASNYVLFWVFTCVATVFMCFVLVLLGVILGKII